MSEDPDKVRRILELEITQEQWETFEACRQALDHDEPEQTFNVMTNLLVAAISLTSKENSIVYLYTRNARRTEFTHVVCPDCKKDIPIFHESSDGFRETGFKLIH